MTGIVLTCAIVLLVGAVVLIERWIQKSRRLDSAQETAEWQRVAARIHEELGRPDRMMLIREVEERAQASKESLTHLCRVTATAMDAPAAVVTVVEYEGQRWLAFYGADWIENDSRAGLLAPLETSYCQYVVATNQTLSIQDARKDPRVATAPDDTKDSIRAYLGHPVLSVQGVPVGSLCVFDKRPRAWSARDHAVLSSFASLVAL
jgi:GAF domain-containing protein